ncbi:MAG: MFS transporter [Acidimicrobiales bacterium]
MPRNTVVAFAARNGTGEGDPMSDDRLVTPRFIVVTLAALAYFVAIAAVLPVLPVYVETDLGGSSFEVGLSVGVMGLSAALLRPILGAIGDRKGRRFVMMTGALIAGAGMLLLVGASSVAMVVLARLVTGVGEAFTFVGAAAAAQDLAPEDRRGEAASYFSLAIYGGLALGPLAGDALADAQGADAVWLFAAVMCAVSAGLAWISAPGATAEMADVERPATWLHRAAVRPGMVLGLVLMAQAGFVSFIQLYSDDIGIRIGGLAFLVFALVVVTLRLVAAKVPDQVPTITLARFAAVCSASGLAIIGLTRSTAGVVIGTVIHAVGQTFLFPGLFKVVIETAGERSRSHAIATFSMFFDLATGLGGITLGLAADGFGTEAAAFLVGAGLCGATALLVGPLVGPAVATHAEL